MGKVWEKDVEAHPYISVVITVFNERPSLIELADRIEAVFRRMERGQSFEIIFVDDGSTDGSDQVLCQLGRERPFVRAVVLRANAGKSIALTAGFRAARGDEVITMDGDLQDCPEDIPALIQKLEDGLDMVVGRRIKRNTSFVRRMGSHLFNRTAAWFTGLHLNDMNCGFKAMRGIVARQLLLMGNFHRYMPVLAHLKGFKVGETPVKNDERKYGGSRYPAIRFSGLFDLFSLLFIRKYRFNPFYFFCSLGAFLLLPGALLLAVLFFGMLLGKVDPGTNLFLAGAVIFFAGLQAILIGFVCDFVLNHSAKRDIAEWIDGNIRGTVNCSPSSMDAMSEWERRGEEPVRMSKDL